MRNRGYGIHHHISELLKWKTSFSCNINDIDPTKYLGVFFGLSLNDSMEMPCVNAENRCCSHSISKDLPSDDEEFISWSHFWHAFRQPSTHVMQQMLICAQDCRAQGQSLRISLQAISAVLLPMLFCVQRGSYYWCCCFFVCLFFVGFFSSFSLPLSV